MNTAKNKIDQSVYISTRKTNMKHAKHIIPVLHAEPVGDSELTTMNFPAHSTAKLEELKTSLMQKFNAEYAGIGARLVYQAVNEALALASLTTVPILLLPALAEEKVQQAASWSARQSSLLHGGPLALAA
jgi:energy-converting hydrogenase Eha subunit E